MSLQLTLLHFVYLVLTSTTQMYYCLLRMDYLVSRSIIIIIIIIIIVIIIVIIC